MMNSLGWDNMLYDAMSEIVIDESSKLKYPRFLVEKKSVDGRMVAKELRFDEGLLGIELSDKRLAMTPSIS